MINEPSILNFKTDKDVNYAISNAFTYAFNIDRSKFLLDTVHWSAEEQVNRDLFVKSTPWYKGYRERLETNTIQRSEPTNYSDSVPVGSDEYNFIVRDKNLVEYVPESAIDPAGATMDMSYKTVDNRVALIALSWWTLFISTKDGRRMIYYPYTSQLKDSENLIKSPGRNVWYKDSLISNYYTNLGLNINEIPDELNMTNYEGYEFSFSLLHMQIFLESEGLNFVLWLYNYIKKNNGLVPYNYVDEYRNSLNDNPVYRDKTTINLEIPNLLGKSSQSDKKSTGQIDSASGISQTTMTRETHSCGLIINNLENITDLNFTNENLKKRLNTKFKRLIVPSNNNEKIRVNKISESSQYSSRINDEATEIVLAFNSMNTRIPINYVSTEHMEELKSYNLTQNIISRKIDTVDEKTIPRSK